MYTEPIYDIEIPGAASSSDECYTYVVYRDRYQSYDIYMSYTDIEYYIYIMYRDRHQCYIVFIPYIHVECFIIVYLEISYVM